MSKIPNYLGPYRLTRLIRMGSTCQVWEAVEATTNQRFALKILRPDQRGNKDEIGFLKHEFDVAGTFSHKNLIKIHSFNQDTDYPYLVLELFSELNMKQALRRGPDSLAFMLDRILEQSAESLFYLHSKGYVHCDVKPDNFLVSRDGDVRLIDFTITQKISKGIGRFFRFKTRAIQGTRSYMSPEQIKGQPLDARSDIYSLGCVLYELVVGKPPFTGESPNDLLNKHISASIPSPQVSNENVTSEYSQLIRNLMAKKPENRPDSMWDVLKLIRGTKIFKRPPRIPDVSVWDDLPSAGRVENPQTVAESDASKAQAKEDGK